MKKFSKSLMHCALVGVSALALAACGGSDDDDDRPAAPAVFEVSMTNITLAQPLSPLAVIAHDRGYSLFEIGEPASLTLEVLAEDGDNSRLITAASVSPSVHSTASGESPFGPSSTQTVTIEVDQDDLETAYLSMATMLVNTNDAITSLRTIDVSELEVGESINRSTISYDTGTEANTEAEGTIPGPVDGGEGFNIERDDVGDRVTVHPGAVTSDDGLSTSILTHIHKWDHPVARVTISRTQ